MYIKNELINTTIGNENLSSFMSKLSFFKIDHSHIYVVFINFAKVFETFVI